MLNILCKYFTYLILQINVLLGKNNALNSITSKINPLLVEEKLIIYMCYGGEIMYSNYGVSYDGYEKRDNKNSFALIVVLFILLIIIGTQFMQKNSY